MNPHEDSKMRAALLADPRLAQQHGDNPIGENAEMLVLQRHLLSLNGAMASTLGEVPIPDGLADRIILRARYRQRSTWLGGIAAGLLLAALALFSLHDETPEPIGVAMLDHVVERADELADDGDVSVESVTRSLARLGVGFQDVGYQIRHLGECVVAGRVGRHLVMNTPQGLVTFIVLPKTAAELPRRFTLTKGEFQAVLQPGAQVVVGAFAHRGLERARMETMMQQMFFKPAGVA